MGIYIPLWFYSNTNEDIMYVKTTEFTFHYGSILIVQESHAWREITRFTFHYGSILIRIGSSAFR